MIASVLAATGLSAGLGPVGSLIAEYHTTLHRVRDVETSQFMIGSARIGNIGSNSVKEVALEP
jgi:hypothetical protein